MRICKSGNLPAVGTGMKIPDHECLIVPNDQNDSPLEVCVFLPIRIPCGVILCGPNPPQDCLFPQDRPLFGLFRTTGRNDALCVGNAADGAFPEGGENEKTSDSKSTDGGGAGGDAGNGGRLRQRRRKCGINRK